MTKNEELLRQAAQAVIDLRAPRLALDRGYGGTEDSLCCFSLRFSMALDSLARVLYLTSAEFEEQYQKDVFPLLKRDLGGEG